ncbi:group II intron maturase-specific domain-containing protein [Spirillospora sp. NPDC048911]|uniref:group II intron maturase-specific domain-containing protein n=1 Tax=Spirillospora sp. NPDC048911 TaxID=3364527 RepID=UPI003711AB55
MHLTRGFDFLGVNIRRYPNGKLMTKPSAAAVRRLKLRLAAEMRSLRGSNAQAVIIRLDPIVRGWAAYYRSVVASRVFTALDNYMWRLTYKWARHNHPNKPRRWVGDRDHGAYLPKFAWTNIVRHVLVVGAASPDDPAQADYWAARRKRIKPPVDRYTLRLLTRQDARCPLCGGHLLTAEQPPQSPDQWERWWLQVVKPAIAADYLVHHGRPGPPDGDQTRLVHASCHRGHRARQRRSTAQSA